MIEICKNIEKIRQERGISQTEMGKKLGMSQQSYSQYMCVNSDLAISMIDQIAKVYNMSIVDLLTYPVHYVPEGSEKPVCEECKQKDEIIANLNDYIKTLKKKK